MKNLAKENPTVLTPRLSLAAQFVKSEDIKGKNVLDIGCGYGWFENYALANGAKAIIGTEITAQDLKTAKKYIKDKRASFKVAGATKLPFNNGAFDTVVAWEVIEHIPKGTENVMFEEVNRVLKKGGKFYLSTPYASWQSKFFDPAWWLIGHRHYSENQLKKYAKDAKFKVQKINIRGKWWSIFSSLDMYISKWLFKRKPLFDSMTMEKVKREYMGGKGFKNIYMIILNEN